MDDFEPDVDPGAERLLRSDRGNLVAREFYTSSAHIPLVLSLAMLLAGPSSTWWLILPALAGGFLQAWSSADGRTAAGRRRSSPT